MEYTKTVTTKRTYQIEFYPDAFDCTAGEFIEQRERLGIGTQAFKKCFICERHLSMYRKPIVASVSGIGNRFVCRGCYEKYRDMDGGQTGEKTEL
jgi:hypothetical protein